MGVHVGVDGHYLRLDLFHGLVVVGVDRGFDLQLFGQGLGPLHVLGHHEAADLVARQGRVAAGVGPAHVADADHQYLVLFHFFLLPSG